MGTNQVKINFASGNPDKIAEVTRILEKYAIKVNAMDSKVREIQADNLEEIAADSARTTANFLARGVAVEDAGLFITCLRGFPGPYSSYVYNTIGCQGILRLMAEKTNRSAIFRSVVSYCDPNSEPLVFTGDVKGRIALAERSGRKFGYDPVFVPEELDGRAFSELTIGEKNSISHRSQSFNKFAMWFLTSTRKKQAFSDPPPKNPSQSTKHL
jgi:XTP/dITP diphosphohydrolase